EEVGAVRMLQRLWPTLGVVVVTSPALEVRTAPIALRLQARLLAWPDAPGQLAAAIEQALLLSDRPRADAFVDLARGVADEINNPLQFVSGHLQLLRASLDAAAEKNRRDQIGAALAGLDKVQASLDRLRLCATAAAGPQRRELVDLRTLLAAALATLPAGVDLPCPVDDGEHVVLGHKDQLGQAFAAVVRLAHDLHAAGAAVSMHLVAAAGGRTLRVVARGAQLTHWALPQSFEPFYPNRALRGQSSGLGLFLAQTIVLGHRGQATVRRLPDAALQFDFTLPA
ncbi:MAG: HAMP domain-containing histidine kinase, partial [Planctomycetes bacterium]|nr:HAMP domain-containing histidine kinase [Planctomycetota bacterium]